MPLACRFPNRFDVTNTIKKFAGEGFEKAKYYPEDAAFLLEFEPHVTHYEVLVKPAQIE